MSPFYKKRPVVVEAVQFIGNFGRIERLVGGDLGGANGGGYVVATLEGALHFSANDWIIKDNDGRFTVENPDTFKAIYELLST
jgi:hypothetical protein